MRCEYLARSARSPAAHDANAKSFSPGLGGGGKKWPKSNSVRGQRRVTEWWYAPRWHTHIYIHTARVLRRTPELFRRHICLCVSRQPSRTQVFGDRPGRECVTRLVLFEMLGWDLQQDDCLPACLSAMAVLTTSHMERAIYCPCLKCSETDDNIWPPSRVHHHRRGNRVISSSGARPRCCCELY